MFPIYSKHSALHKFQWQINVKESDDAIEDEEVGAELDDTENQPSTSKVKDLFF